MMAKCSYISNVPLAMASEVVIRSKLWLELQLGIWYCHTDEEADQAFLAASDTAYERLKQQQCRSMQWHTTN